MVGLKKKIVTHQSVIQAIKDIASDNNCYFNTTTLGYICVPEQFRVWLQSDPDYIASPFGYETTHIHGLLGRIRISFSHKAYSIEYKEE